MQIRCRRVSRGVAEGPALVSSEPISFFGMVDPKSGIIQDRRHGLYGQTVAGKVLVFPHGKGSTVGSYVIYQLAVGKRAPLAMVCKEAEPIVAVGAIMAGIPMVDRPESFDFTTGEWLTVDADRELIEKRPFRSLINCPQDR
ncbi:MAG: DUF126 domain-containing protein [Candidatus Bathyarchaeia archaeon]